jgi:hypothetical protein
MRQSLWLSPSKSLSSTDTTSTENSIYGYYADGFYDRRKVDRTNESNGIVAKGTHEVAYGGRLFFNPNTMASLFFPVAGDRSNANGTLQHEGLYGYYLTSYVYLGSAMALSMRNQGFLVMAEVMRSQGSHVRCVKNP